MPSEVDELERLLFGTPEDAGPPGPPSPPSPAFEELWAQHNPILAGIESVARTAIKPVEAVAGAPKAAVDWAARQAGYASAGEAARAHPFLTTLLSPPVGMALQGATGIAEELQKLGYPRAAALFQGAAEHGAELATDPLMWAGAGVIGKIPAAGKALQALLAKGLTEEAISAFEEFESNGASERFWSLVGAVGVDVGTIGGLHALARGARRPGEPAAGEHTGPPEAPKALEAPRIGDLTEARPPGPPESAERLGAVPERPPEAPEVAEPPVLESTQPKPPQATAPIAPTAPESLLAAGADPAILLSEIQQTLLERRSGPHTTEFLDLARKAKAAAEAAGQEPPVLDVGVESLRTVLRNLGWDDARIGAAAPAEITRALEEVGLRAPKPPAEAPAREGQEGRLSDQDMADLLDTVAEALGTPREAEFVLGDHPLWKDEIKPAIRLAEAAGVDRPKTWDAAADDFVAKYPESEYSAAERAELRKQFRIGIENREHGRMWLEEFQQQLDESPRRETPDRVYSPDEKTKLVVKRWGVDPKNATYYVLNPIDGRTVEAAAAVYDGKYARIVGGDRVMDQLHGSTGALYRVLDGIEGIEHSTTTLPAGRSAQVRAARAGLDVRGARPILGLEVKGTGKREGGEDAVSPRIDTTQRPADARGSEVLRGDEGAREVPPGEHPEGAERGAGAPTPDTAGAAGPPGPPAEPPEPIRTEPRLTPPTGAGNFAVKAETPSVSLAEATAPPSGAPLGSPGPPGPPELTSPILRLTFHQEVVGAAGEALKAAGIVWDKARYPTLSDQLAVQLLDGTIPLPTVLDAVQARGLTLTDFVSQLWRPAVTDAARRLQALSALSRQLEKIAADPTAAAKVKSQAASALDGLGTEIDEFALAQSWWKRLDNVRRGMLVTQVSTMMRNAETQVVRLGVGALNDALDYGLQQILKSTGANIQPTVHPLEGLRVAMTAFRALATGGKGTTAKRQTALVDALLGDGTEVNPGVFHPKFRNRLFNSFASDISSGIDNYGIVVKGVDRGLRGLERTVDWLNTLNRGQEFIFRRVVFTGKLDSELASAARKQGKPGKTLADVIEAHNQLVGELEAKFGADYRTTPEAQQRYSTDPRNIRASIDEGMIQRSVQKALEMTFAESPAHGTAASALIHAVNRVPGLTLLLPFPRFMYNSLKFTFDYNPTGFLKLLSSAERAKLGQGDTSTISKAVVGSAMLLAAYVMRKDKELAGERWYQFNVKLPGSDKVRTVDIRPFNPFAAQFFIADLIVRKQENRAYQLSSQDVIEGIAAANLRAGTGLALLDGLMKQATSLGSWSDVERFGARIGGELVAGFLTPLQVVTDFCAQFDSDSRIVRDRRQSPFLGPIISKLPLQGKQLPELELATREGPTVGEFPALKQATGLLLSDPQNPLEHELGRLQFAPNEVFRGSRSPQADALIKHYLGQISEEYVAPVILTPEYQALTDAEKGMYLAQLLASARKTARAIAKAEQPELFAGLRSLTLRERILQQQEEAEQDQELAAGPPEAPDLGSTEATIGPPEPPE